MKTHKTKTGPSSDAGSVIIYEGKSRRAGIEVRLAGETIWLSQAEMAALFKTERSVITKHVGNIFKSRELDAKSNVQKMHIAVSDRPVKYFSLDVVISVGYRVNSRRATRFRIWATRVLRQHLIEGYTLNSRLLAEQREKLEGLKKAITLVRNAHASKVLDYSEAAGLLDIIENYSYALGLLDDYDRGSLKISHTTPGGRFRLSYEMVAGAVAGIRSRIGAGGLFGLEKDRSLRSSVAAIYQTFGGKDLYPSAEEKAAALLYFMVKNHSFVDGNKRIAAAVFLWFLEKNRLLYRSDGSKRLADNALVALTLMIAESRPAERVAITALVVNLINDRN